MHQYLDFLRFILDRGIAKEDRTQTGTLSVFGYQMRFSLVDQFPLVTTKKIYWKGVVHELLWFIRGDTNVGYLQQNGVGIWNEWANEEGELGPVYGKQWRSWQTADGQEIDQLQNLIANIKRDPSSRRHLMSTWNVGELAKMALQPCHVLCQFYVVNGVLSCHLYQRSADAFLGIPFNIASYSLLTYMIADQCGLTPQEFILSVGDAHIYNNHIQQVQQQLQRSCYQSPQLLIKRKVATIFDYQYSDFELLNYHYHPAIKAPIAV